MDIQQVANDIHNEKVDRSESWKKEAEIKPTSLPELASPKNRSRIMGKMKRVVRRLPFFASGFRIFDKLKGIRDLHIRHEILNREFLTLNHQFILSQQALKELQSKQQTLAEQTRILSQSLAAIGSVTERPKPETAPLEATLPHQSFDQLYRAFEDRFRGSEEVVRKKQAQYIDRINALPDSVKAKPVADIGCGRGEWTELLRSHSFQSIGIEPNESMAKEAKDKNLSVEITDALSFLNKAKPQSLGGVTSFHVIEHLEFEYLFTMLQKANDAVTSGGFILLETPNPENVVVGTCNFYTDPTHIKPLPPDALQFYVEQAGFINVEIIRTTPMRKYIHIPHPLLNEMAQRFFGPQDYAVIGYKV